MDSRGLEVWGGIECTVCRIGDRYIDQTVRSGHELRADDLDKVASLGIRRLRYPVLWERVAPEGLAKANWAWTDERLERLERLGITPIVTLLHHGSGPRETDLLDPEFPKKLARFAGAVARRYPHLPYFTPVNEPLTTARFCALYGWWHPHHSDERAFYTALLHQVEAIGAAMRAVRRHIPDARLITTEDLGKTYAPPSLEYQAAHENARRFLTYDLLCGTLDANPHMRQHLFRLGLNADARFEKRFLCAPDVLGFNYYVTGERRLDDRISLYPGHRCEGNGRHRYVDIEAVRCAEGARGVGPLLRECWERYRRPLALTEAHIACEHLEQMRWLRDLHAAVLAERAAGADVRALTVWSLLGAFDWNTMQTRQDGHYESGAFDVSSGTALETPLADYVRRMAAQRNRLVHVPGTGWWERPDRVLSTLRRSA